MKKLIALLLVVLTLVSVVPFAAAACETCTDANGDQYCDVCETLIPGRDCDASGHTDPGGDGYCDACGAEIPSPPSIPSIPCFPAIHIHVDNNGDNRCDAPNCREYLGNGYDHQHTWYSSRKYNSTYHWRECWCGAVQAGSKVKHHFNRNGQCTGCNYRKPGCDWDWDYDYGYGDYRVYLSESGRGDASVSDRYADRGETVYIYVDPDYGYKVKNIEVYTRGGSDIRLTKHSSSKYSFKMPGKDVYVEVTFTGSKYNDNFEYSQWYGNNKYNNNYSDVAANAWYASYVEYVTDRNIMEGISYNRFAPDANLTRAALAEALWNIAGNPNGGKENFSDVSSYDEFADAVAWCASKDIILGYNGKFDPNGDITREQIAVMLMRYAEYKRLNTKASEDLSDYADAGKISEYAVEAMEWAVAEGLINGMGDGTLAPQGTTTRAQAAAILMRFVKNVVR